MVIILSFALLFAIIGLCVEIGIASWNIRRAGEYRRKASAAERTSERAVNERRDLENRMKFMDDYATEISWLLNFLYNRYDKFADLETEVQEGLNGVTDDTSIGEADGKYKDLKKALKLIRVTVKASERMDNLMSSVIAQVDQIREDFQEKEDKPESDISGESNTGVSSDTEAK
jgi:hypothetical protein